MSPRKITYYFGRLNIIANYDNKSDFILNALKSPKIFQHRQSAWGFFDIQTHDNTDYCSGWLVKYKPGAVEEIALPEKHALGDQAIPNLVTAKSRFFLHIQSGLMAFHPVTPDIQISIFMERFCSCLENAHDGMLVSAEITLIEDEYEIFQAIDSFSSIKQITISLHPSNPNNRDLWKNVDQRLRNLKATRYVEQYDTDRPDGSLMITKDEDIKSKVTMAVDGYGKASISGVMDGRNRIVTTEDNPVTEDAQSDDVDASSVLDVLKQRFRAIMERFIQ